MIAEKIPAELRQLRQWVLWKTVERCGLPTKLPFQTDDTAAKSNDPQTWTAFEAACDRFERGGYDGIGFMFSESDPFCGIDLDGCRNPETGQIAEWAKVIILMVNSYTEVSPSQTGVKIFLRGKSPFGVGRKVQLECEKVSDKEPGIEVYDKLRYFAVTGKRLAGVSPNVEDSQVQLEAVCRRMFPEKPPPIAPVRSSDTVSDRAAKYLKKLPAAISGMGGHNATFRAACILVLGFGLSPDEAYPLLADWNLDCQPPWSERELRHKLESASQQSGERNYLRDAKPEEWKSIAIPEYPQPEEASGPLVTTLADAAKQYLESIKGGGSGLIELGLPDVDYALGGGVELGEMVVLAARPSHGKSAVALQAIHGATARGRASLIISEEMSSLALGKRVIQYASEVPQEHWSHDQQVIFDLDEHFSGRAKCIVVESCRTADRAADEIRKAVDNHGVTFAVVDYAQLLGSKGGSRYEQITNTSITLRQVASQCKIVLLVLCQLSRAIEGRTSFTPLMSDLKDSGQIEQDADVILFLCWPHRLDSKRDANEYLFFVGKNRNRAINQPTVKCRFEPGRQMFLSERGAGTNWDEFEAPSYDDVVNGTAGF